MRTASTARGSSGGSWLSSRRLLWLQAVTVLLVLLTVRTYGDVVEGEACALVGSSRRLEVAIHGGNASRLLGAGRGASVLIRAALTAPDRARSL